MTNQISDTAAALASALPFEIDVYDIGEMAAYLADRLAEQGWVLVRPDDEATEWGVRGDTGLVMAAYNESYARSVVDDGLGPKGAHVVRRTVITGPWVEVAALAARPGDAEDEETEVDR